MIFGRRAVNVLTAGVLGGPTHQALERRLFALVAQSNAHDTLRLYRLAPTASVGRHQALARELRLDYCHRNGIEIVRRLTGGGALYLDPDQLGFSLVARGRSRWRGLPLGELLRKFTLVVCRALRARGLPARIKPPNDVEVNGGKIASVYLARRAGAILVHGTVLLEANVKPMLEALRVPTEKLTADGLASARERFATVNALRGVRPSGDVEAALVASFERMLGARARYCAGAGAGLSATAEEREAERAFARLIAWEDDEDAIESVMKTGEEATLRARAAFDAAGRALRRVEFATDAHLEPANFLHELQDALVGLDAPMIEEAVVRLARRRGVRGCRLTSADLVAVLHQLAAKHRLRQRHGFTIPQVNALMLRTNDRLPDITALLGKASVMLVPYCAKPAWCKWRHRDGCIECGLCEVGDAYRLARERRMQVTTVTHYEHLVETLRRMKDGNVAAYVGMCCGHFFIKRQRAFAQAGIPALLMDVSGANCYALQQEREAYAGTFRAEATLDAELLARVMSFVPSARAGADSAAS